MITLVGVGHVFRIGSQVRRAIVQRRPKVVCVELDRERYLALLARRRRGGGPLGYRALSFFQSWIAKKFGASVGEEMLAAAHSAQEVGARLEFIDMDSTHIFSRFWEAMSFKDRVRMVLAIGSSLFLPRRRVEEEIARYEADNSAYLRSFEEEFPEVKRILIDERDEHMAMAIGRLSDEYGDVVAVVGDGHIEGLRSRLAGRPVEVVRLKDLREPVEESGVVVTFSIGEGENRKEFSQFGGG
jgi:pheromone shutdown protein TraB